jgi:cysteine desulfurase NifS
VAQDFPLVFNSGARLQTDFRSQHHGIEGLVKDSPEPVVEMNSDDAKARGIESGDLVAVRTARGSVNYRAFVTDDIVAGAVECNMGGGSPVGPRAWQEANVNELTDLGNYDEISGFPVYKALLCDVAKVAQGTEATHPRRTVELASCEAPAFGKLKLKRQGQRRIYLDNNATTYVADAVREAMLPYLDTHGGNPSSIHGAGRDAREAIDRARRQVARLINAKPKRIVFTGGGSEADNLALKGVAFLEGNRGKHIITTRVEHPAILAACSFLERAGFPVTYLDVDRDGWLDPQALEAALRPDTMLVSIMMANNEVGTILPIRELCEIAHAHDVLFHTDAVQAAGKIPVDVEALDVDMLSLSAHKFHGPKGIGALYVRKGVQLEPVIHGGKQEGGLRAGTENVPAIVGFGKAAELALQSLAGSEHLASLRDRLEQGVRRLVPDAQLNGHASRRLPNTVNLTLPELRGESLVVALDQQGISISSGSACKSGSPKPTHVLLAMGRSDAEAHCAIRLSLSHGTTEQDVDDTVEALEHVLEEMRTTVRFLPCK